MYASDPLRRKLWAKSESGGDALASSVHLTPLRKTERATAAQTSPARSNASTTRSPLPPVAWRTSSSPDFEDTNSPPGRTTVMDPLAALRRCMKYICSHPEVYGNDIRGLLDRELMHVVRLKASEVSLIQGQRPLLVDPLDSTSLRQASRSFASPGALPSITGTTNTTAAPALGGASTCDDCVPVGDLFGYGSVSFLPANSAGFSALMQDTRAHAMNSGLKTFSGRDASNGASALPLLPGVQLMDERIQWNSTLPPSLSAAGAAEADRKSGGGGNRTTADDADDTVVRSGGDAHVAAAAPVAPAASSLADYSPTDPYRGLQRPDDAQLFRLVDEPNQTIPPAASLRGEALCTADGTALVLDHDGYEVTYLRTQLQQLEAAFNAKCVRLHELESENKLFAEQMRASEEAAARWSAEHHAMEGKLEALRRELEGWKDRANDALAAATQQNKQRSQHAKQLASNQINDAKQEAARVSQLWRETERALQESRRAFENTEKEASAAHKHLTDAFHYIERLERRVARRDAYVQLCERRHRSLEEKYEKLMWGYEELSAIEGRYSYVDYLLTTRPLWSVCLFLALAHHRGDYIAVEDQGELKQRLAIMVAPFTAHSDAAVASKAATVSTDLVDPQSWLLFARTPHGGCYAGSCYDPSLVLRLMVAEVTAEVMRCGRAKQLRTNLHGSVACRVLRWGERFGIDYLGGQDNFPDSGELNRKFVPVLTLASVLLPLRSGGSGGGVFLQSEAPAGEAGTAPSAASVAAPIIPNNRHYDEATVRFVLRCFWKERLNAFVRQMETRVAALEAKRQRLERLRAQKQRSSRSVNPIDPGKAPGVQLAEGPSVNRGQEHAEDEAAEEEEEIDEDATENAATTATFLAALVDFAARFTKVAVNAGDGSAGTSAVAAAPPGVVDIDVTAAESSSSSSPPPAAADKSTLLRVRGVLARSYSAKATSGGSTSRSKATGNAVAAPTEAALWNCGRVFFATVLLRRSHTTSGDTAAAATATTSASAGVADVTKSTFNETSADAEVAALADDVRELLAALYFYTMEYKSSDADFRLFYLVSHQLIPEMVAVNFFASLEGFQRDCAALLEKRIQYVAGERDGCGDDVPKSGYVMEPTGTTTAVTFTTSAGALEQPVEDPLTCLTETVQIIDEAPLDGEDVEIEPDSDGEGYGSIIPFHAKANVHDRAAPVVDAAAPLLGAPSPSSADYDAHSESARNDSSPSSRGTQRRTRELRLLHNIRAYLKERERGGGVAEADNPQNTSSCNGGDLLSHSGDVAEDGAELIHNNGSCSSAVASPTAATLPAFAFGDATPEWKALEDAVAERLAPHTALLDAFRARCVFKRADSASVSSFPSTASRRATATSTGGTARHDKSNSNNVSGTLGVKEDRGYLRQRHADRKMRYELTKCLSATRGLLTLDDVLALLKRHCFATYAVSCCGTPRFSLTDALMEGSAGSVTQRASLSRLAQAATPTTSAAVRPFSIVGYLPPTALQLQRLRFALSLDQPCDLIDVAKLFTVDAVTKANSHLYDTYLTLTLDLFQQQQSFLMQSVLASCAGRHERYAAEGAEDCDGQIPIASLRKGMTHALSTVQGSVQHATALVNHFVQYDELMRLEDEVKLEQFADAPLLLNVPAGLTASPCRKSEANSVMEEVEDAEFNLREEAETCSLLHIAFAVRMTYIVWGRLCADTAAAVVHRVVQRAVPTCCSNTGDAQFPYSRGDNFSYIRVAEMPEWDIFERGVHQQYALTLSRLRDGHNADDNPLRRTLRGEFMKALGLSLPLPYAITAAAGAASATNAAVGCVSFGGDGAAADAVTLYPDITHAFRYEDTTPAQPASAESDAHAASSSSTGKTKKKERAAAAAATPHVSASASKRSSAIPAEDEEKAACKLPQLPDYGLISFSRALNFAPSITAAAAVGGGAGPSGSSAKKGAGKKTAKKPPAKKAGGADSCSLSADVQEEYSRALSMQLQSFATQIARLAQPVKPLIDEVSGTPEAAPTDGQQLHAAGGPLADAVAARATEPTCIFASPSGDAAAAAAGPTMSSAARVTTTRTRSVAFVQDMRSGRGQDDDRLSTVNSNGDALSESGVNAGRPLMWRPVFAEEARGAEANGDRTASANPSLDVSKLYAACAALSIL
ncbi:hypothetical protein N2W54_007051 [Lotmaria passim]